MKMLEHQNISDKTYNVLLEMIIGGQFEPGEPGLCKAGYTGSFLALC